MPELRDRAVQARHEAECGLCPEPISEGDWIVKVDGAWVHLTCAEDEEEG